MKRYLIKCDYEYEIEANSEEEALEEWCEIVDELAIFESLYAEEIENKKTKG